MESPEFLKKKYGELHTSSEVESAAKRTEKRSRLREASASQAGEKVSEKPAERIQNYLNRFKEIIERKDPREKERGLEALKTILHKKFVIKPEEIPESYWETQRRIAREQGRGDIEITEEMRDQGAEIIIADQQSSLDNWIDYLVASPDADFYPDWLKYWAIRSVIGMSDYDKEKHQFTKRSQGTVKPFPSLNHEALGYVLDAVEKKYGREKIDPEKLNPEDQKEFQKLLQGENFAKLYAFTVEKFTPASKEILANTGGQWVKYKQGSDPAPLVGSIQGHNTGWCTATSESIARGQLQGGDFYVYYSLDKEGQPTIPRSAILMRGNQIEQVRGIAPEQNLDPHIGEVVQNKLQEFPDGPKYEKKAKDMKFLTQIEKKTQAGQPLLKDDLIFLYEINSPIEGFGYQKDPRIQAVKEGRNVKADLAFALNIPQERISVNQTEALKGGILFHNGDLYLGKLASAEGLKLPEQIGGDLYLGNFASAEGLKLPEQIGGYLNLDSLTSAKDLKLPEQIGGNLNLYSLTSAKDLKLPEQIGGNLNLGSLTSAKDLKLPEQIGGNLNLDRLTSAEGLKLPEQIGGNLNLYSLTSAKDLKLPEQIGGNLYLWRLTSAEKNQLRKEYPDLKII